MPADVKFNVQVKVINPAILPELQARMADLSPAFQAIYMEWVGINEQKFSLARGAEISGADIFGEPWAALTPGYIKQKHPTGAPKRRRTSTGEYPDWLMVRTGALKEAMTDPDALFKEFDAQQAMFGTPNDPDLADIVMWQTGERQKERFVVFISEPDMNAIERNLQDYFGLGGNFAAIRFAQGMDVVKAESGGQALDAGFDFSAGGEG